LRLACGHGRRGAPLGGTRERRGHWRRGAAGCAASRRCIELVIELRLLDQGGLRPPAPGLRGDELGALRLGWIRARSEEAFAGGLGLGSGGALHLCLLAHDQLVEQLLALALGVLHLLLEQHGAHRRWNDAQALMEGRCDHRDRGRRIDGARSRLGTDSGRRVSHRVLIRGRISPS
jgi:hypothetical protein